MITYDDMFWDYVPPSLLCLMLLPFPNSPPLSQRRSGRPTGGSITNSSQYQNVQNGSFPSRLHHQVGTRPFTVAPSWGNADLRAGTFGPLFVHANGVPLTRAHFTVYVLCSAMLGLLVITVVTVFVLLLQRRLRWPVCQSIWFRH
jgi:hypothetical protein